MLRTFILTLAVMFCFVNVECVSAQTSALPTSDGANKARITVSITGIRNDKGQIFIQLWNSSNGFPMQADKSLKLVAMDATKAVNGTVETTFVGLGPGTYAISILHDENRNGKMDTNTFGIPKEGWAVSNNIVTRMHAPSFDQASFKLTITGQFLSLALHY